jgi:alpha-glucosidase
VSEQRTVTSPWWRDAVIYEVYLRSFADGNADGEGDLAGLRSRLSYLAELGVDALWIAPWYPSPLADGGYDVTDYRDIHPRFGTLADADALLAEAHGLGLRVIVDLVANHTSVEHPWFSEALADGPGSVSRSRYFFRPGRGPSGDQPPNNWISAFGGPAWTRVIEPDGRPGEWFLHTFAPEQPDLCWGSADVVEEFDDILRFWLDRGVDGFRVDAAAAMGKKPGLPDAAYGDDLRFAATEWVDNPHWDHESVHQVFRRWRALLDSYPGDRMLVAEAVVNGPERLSRYLRPGELHTAFNFDYVHAAWSADELRGVIDSTLRALAPIGAPATWALASHDEVRPPTRFGRARPDGPVDLELGSRRARAAIMLSLALPGGTYLYQGEELGLPEVDDLPEDLLQDPVFSRTHGQVRGRDGCRVPLPWRGERAPFGFSPPGTRTWLPQPPEWAARSVEAQQREPDSTLNLYRRALELRRETTRDEGFRWLPAPPHVIDFRRGRLRCVVNLGATPHPLTGSPSLTSAPLLPGDQLPGDAAAWILEAHSEPTEVDTSIR